MVRLGYPYGTVIISIDMELTSGLISSPNLFSKEYLNLIQEEGENMIRSVLSLFEIYSVPATWGIVGRLFLDNKDIIKDIISSPINHDVGCHSFSHINFDNCSQVVASNEIKESIKVMKEYKITPRSFIFPGNKVNHIDVLAENGFIVFRGKAPILKRASLYAAKFAGTNLIRNAFSSLSYGLVNPQKESHGLWNIPGSMTMKKYLSTNSIVSTAKNGVDGALNSKKIFHFYFHFHDFFHPRNIWTTNERLQGFESVISYIDKKRDEENLQVTTMSELAKYLNQI